MFIFNIFILTVSLIVSYSSFSSDIELKKSKAVVVVDDSNNIWWGRYISSHADMVKVKLNPDNKNISYKGFDAFVSNVPRDKIFTCVDARSKMHFMAYNVPGTHRPWLTCTNGIITNSSGSYYLPKKYTLEIHEINGIMKGSKIIADLKEGTRRVRVKRVFADGNIYYYDKKTESNGWVLKDKVKLRSNRPNFNKASQNDGGDESTMVSLLESKSTIQ